MQNKSSNFENTSYIFSKKFLTLSKVMFTRMRALLTSFNGNFTQTEAN